MSVEPGSENTSEPDRISIGRGLPGRLDRWPAALLAFLGASALLAYLASLVAYLVHPGFTDQVEPALACISALLFHGLQLYPVDPATPPCGMQYGALSYLPPALFMRVLENSILASKLPAILAAGTGLAAITLFFRRLSSWPLALMHGGLLALWLLMLLQRSYWARPDPYLLLVAGGALWTLKMKNPGSAAVVLGFFLGAAFGLKINAVAALFPILAMLWQKHGWGPSLKTLASAGLIALLPFAFPGVSLSGFITMLGIPLSQGYIFAQFLHTLALTAQMLIPFAIILAALAIADRAALAREFRQQWAFWLALPVSFLIAALVSSKRGADTDHLIPLLPVFGYALLRLSLQLAGSYPRLRREAPPSFAPVSTAIVFLLLGQAVFLVNRAYAGQSRVWTMYRANAAYHRAVLEDQQRIIDTLPGKRLAMGFGDGGEYVATWMRSELIRRGHPYLIEPNNLMDLQSAGIEVFPERALDPAEVDAWIIPRSGKPFTMMNWNKAGPMLPPEFADRFLREWEKKGASQAFDVYFPRATGASP